jgi:hypothetical protein
MSWWRKNKPEKPLRAQLIEARDNLERQLDIVTAGPIKLAWQPGTIEELRAALAEINRQLEEVGPDDG